MHIVENVFAAGHFLRMARHNAGIACLSHCACSVCLLQTLHRHMWLDTRQLARLQQLFMFVMCTSFSTDIGQATYDVVDTEFVVASGLPCFGAILACFLGVDAQGSGCLASSPTALSEGHSWR
jgi:hypothetical protein